MRQSGFAAGLFFLLAVCFAPHGALAGVDDVEAGMVDWPHDEMTRALDYFIGKRMKELDVPGLALVIVSDGKIVFEKGYGIADTDGDQPVTENTLFEVGSLGMPIEAYGAMLLAGERKLFLDAPLSRALETPWLPGKKDSAAITLRHVLTHSSGLTDWVRLGLRGTRFEPGERFGYSGMGYVYLAHVMAAVEETPFDRLMRTRVFRPLGMSSSGYVVPDALVDSVARGHHALWVPIAVFALPLFGSFAIFALVTLLIVRFGFQRLRLEPADLLPALILAPLVTCASLYLFRGGWTLLFCAGYFLAWLAAVAGTAAMLQYFRFIFEQGRYDSVVSRGASRRLPVSPVILGGVFAASLFFMPWQVPAPARDGDDFNPALSLRSSAHDLGLFISGFIDGAVIGPEWRARMVQERIEIGGRPNDVFGWGLGFGTRERPDSLTIWQESGYIGTAGLMVIDPARRAGVVVLANADSGARLTQEIAGHVLGPEEPWQLP
ncbi:serine hydrolase [Parvibaculum sp.]|uniref:serine hydrolase domain-containing protein n=1 Tax=Parvibaculum sp. TaxID=2024848 RepID=UPI0027320378|nr:serine hydrolase domain-containing protein [Parvibaculum sp.]MDP2148096.1 serine hydrolase domain-containing protein [Parvibaculum sp.]MDP3329364.1 serine hydrolase domain-containing protein [Parvibaculum sp.]